VIACPNCHKIFDALDEPCKKCLGARLVLAKDAGSVGVTPADIATTGKRKPCPRCNGNGTERSAANRHNRSKGAANEAKAVKTFTEWWKGPTSQSYEFRRTPQSGGSSLAAGFGMAGDICTNAPDWPFHVEAKRDKGWDFEQLFTTDGAARIGDFVKQAVHDAPATKIPMLFMMHPGPSQPTFVMLILSMEFTRKHKFCNLDEYVGVAGGQVLIDGTRHGYYVMSLKKFLGFGVERWRNYHKEFVESLTADQQFGSLVTGELLCSTSPASQNSPTTT
jgi:hypothetical protein